MQNTSMPSSEQTLQGLCAVEVTKTAWFGGGTLPCPARLLSLCGVTRFPRAVGGRWANREKKKKVSPWQAGIGFPRVPGERFLSLLDHAGGSRMPAFSFSGWAGQGCPGVG